jgi:broad specificity phosphatase PhoE
VIERVSDGLNELYASYAGKVIALVAHGFVAKVARAVSQEGFQDFFEWQLANGAVCELTMTANPSIEGMPKRLRLLCIPHVKR